MYICINSFLNQNNKMKQYQLYTAEKKKKNTKHFAIYLQAVQLHLGPNQLLICVSTFPYISLFNSAGNIFQIRTPKSLTVLSPNVTEFPIVTLRSSLRLLEFTRFPSKLCMQKKLTYLWSRKHQVLITILAKLLLCICMFYLIVFKSLKCNKYKPATG